MTIVCGAVRYGSTNCNMYKVTFLEGVKDSPTPYTFKQTVFSIPYYIEYLKMRYVSL